MAFVSSQKCPLGDEKKCNGKQQKNKDGLVYNICAYCQKSKERLKRGPL